MSDSPASETSDASLIEQFEEDLRSGASYRVCLKRPAARALRSRGRRALEAIVVHLERHRELDTRGLRLGWGILLYQIQIDIDPRGSAPTNIADTPGWIAWARLHVR